MPTKKLPFELTVGADPELFVVNKEGKFRSAHGMIPGNKESPFPVKNGAVQVDGMALEFNIDPVTTENAFVNKTNSVMAQMKAMLPEGHDFSIVPTARFNGNHFRVQPDEAKELGCEPDYNAYTMMENEAPDQNTTTRTAAGHIHLGFCDVEDPFEEEHMVRCATLVKQLDTYLGLPSVIYDEDQKRRQMYGKAGCFRPKKYGLEYRVLSNAWLTSEDRMRFVFKQATQAVRDLVDGKRLLMEEAQTDYYINNGNRYGAGGRLCDLGLRNVYDEAQGLRDQDPERLRWAVMPR